MSDVPISQTPTLSPKRADPVHQPHNDVFTDPGTLAVRFHRNTAREQAMH